jgi:hypothetical protein
MKIRRFNESNDYLDIDTLLNLLFDIKDEFEWLDIVLQSANGSAKFIEDYDDLDKGVFKFKKNFGRSIDRCFQIDLQYDLKDFKQYVKIISACVPLIETLKQFGYEIKEIITPNDEGNKLLIRKITFKFRSNQPN